MWELKQNGTAHGHGGPAPWLGVSFTGRFVTSAEPARILEHIGTHQQASIFELGVLWPRVYVPCSPRMNAERHVEFHVQLPLTSSYVNAIENARQVKRPGDLTLQLKLGFVCYPVAKESGTTGKVARFNRGEARVDQDVPVDVRISQNEWHGVLVQVGHDQIDVFEIPSRTKVEIPKFAEAVHELHHAHASYRSANWQDTIVGARKACEDVLLTVGQGDLKRGADALGKLIFPADEDEPRRDYVQGVCRAVGALRNAASHVDPDVRFRANRADADAALGLAFELFRYIASATPKS